MFIAMNRFKIALGMEEGFEKLWRERDSHLKDNKGFRDFHLLRGPQTEEYTLYASHTVWETEADFWAWTESESFKASHAKAKAPKGTYLSHPQLETFQSIL